MPNDNPLGPPLPEVNPTSSIPEIPPAGPPPPPEDPAIRCGDPCDDMTPEELEMVAATYTAVDATTAAATAAEAAGAQKELEAAARQASKEATAAATGPSGSGTGAQGGLQGADKKLDRKENPPGQDETNGIHNTTKKENVPKFNNLFTAEKVIKKGNSWIVMGRDRPADPSSGYGGSGDSRASAIDICVGRNGFAAKIDPKQHVDNNFGSFTDTSKPGDAARIYLSQRADIDDYFGLCDGNGRAELRSAIAIKADDVRIIARRGIKIITGHVKQRDSLNNRNNMIFGIDLIAGNIDVESEGISPFSKSKPYIQPLVKGDNLVIALNKMNDAIFDLNSLVNSILLQQMQFVTAVTNSSMAIVGSGGGVSGAVNCTMPGVIAIGNKVTPQLNQLNQDVIMQRNKLKSIGFDHLISSGAEYVCSKYNRTN
jgi:hypothetical protein